MGLRKDIYQMKGLLLVPINWDILRPRKLKKEVWSIDTTKQKQNKQKSRKKGNRI